jgi:phosphoribosylanthranilate isomerase
MVSVKICGLTSESDLESAIRAGADRVGFVLVPTSPRFVEKTRASRMANKAYHMEYVPDRWVDVWVVANWSLSGGPHTTGLDQMVAKLPDIAAVQLHGKETPEDVEAFKHLAPRTTVVKAVGVSTREDLEQVKLFEAADMFLLDAKPPPGADREGGFGRPFDWSILQGFDPGKPWVLSGGLTAGNVAEAIRISGAKAVDVSSGVEASPGVKDAAKVRAFIEAAKGAV